MRTNTYLTRRLEDETLAGFLGTWSTGAAGSARVLLSTELKGRDEDFRADLRGAPPILIRCEARLPRTSYRDGVKRGTDRGAVI
jgi:hypothetical protein